jgi:hypothetical protein
MSAVTIRAPQVIWGSGLLLALGVMTAACSTGSGAAGPAATTSAPSTSVVVATTAAPPTIAPTTSTTLVPPAPQPTPDQAADQLVASWAAGDRAGAGAVATPAAVDQLFATPYPGPGLAIPRGCSAAFPPIVCTYGPPGGASPSDSIYQLYVSSSTKGWYVSSVSTLP